MPSPTLEFSEESRASDKRGGYVTAVAGLTLLAPALLWWGAAGLEPTIHYPIPLLVFIPAIFGMRQMAVLIPVIAFYLWNVRLFGGDPKIPKRTPILLISALVLDVLYMAAAYRDGLAMQGARYTYTVCEINGAWTVVLLVLLMVGRKMRPTFGMNLLLQWITFLWFAWYAFPFFGELP
jgi:hypothetical protein